MVTRVIFKVNGKWQLERDDNAIDVCHVEMNLEDNINVDLKTVMSYYNKGCGKAGSYGVSKRYGFSDWADGDKGIAFEPVNLDDYNEPDPTPEEEAEVEAESKEEDVKETEVKDEAVVDTEVTTETATV